VRGAGGVIENWWLGKIAKRVGAARRGSSNLFVVGLNM